MTAVRSTPDVQSRAGRDYSRAFEVSFALLWTALCLVPLAVNVALFVAIVRWVDPQIVPWWLHWLR